jgi:hypothetical protein
MRGRLLPSCPLLLLHKTQRPAVCIQNAKRNLLLLLDNSNTARQELCAPIRSATLPKDGSSKEKFRGWILSSAVYETV